MWKGATFERVEKKYFLTPAQQQALLAAAGARLAPDQYGRYTICNLYLDTWDDALIRRSLEKPPYKAKLRLRSYGVPQDQDPVFLELKKKYRGVVYKRRITLPQDQAMDYLLQGTPPQEQGQIFREIDYFLSLYRPFPKLYLAYDRWAFRGTQDPELRVTFDTRIRSRDYRLDLTAGDDGTLLLPQEAVLMELKTVGAIPLWLCHLLSQLAIYPVSFSKYGAIYQRRQEGRGPWCLRVS